MNNKLNFDDVTFLVERLTKIADDEKESPVDRYKAACILKKLRERDIV